MAAIIRNEKEGKLVSFKFKACLGRDECGKQIFRCTTWRVPEDMSPAKEQKSRIIVNMIAKYCTHFFMDNFRRNILLDIFFCFVKEQDLVSQPFHRRKT